VLDGLHRYRLSLALGFPAIPATQPSPDNETYSLGVPSECRRQHSVIRLGMVRAAREQERS
jgi:hypothetical protein